MPSTPKSFRPSGPKIPKVGIKRKTANQRGYNYKWQKARRTYLDRRPYCVHCEEAGRVTLATVVDHIIPHRGCQKLFWDNENNWQPLCEFHHNSKTAKEGGGGW